MMRNPPIEDESGSVEAAVVDQQKEAAAAAAAGGARRKYREGNANGVEITNKRAKIDPQEANATAGNMNNAAAAPSDPSKRNSPSSLVDLVVSQRNRQMAAQSENANSPNGNPPNGTTTAGASVAGGVSVPTGVAPNQFLLPSNQNDAVFARDLSGSGMAGHLGVAHTLQLQQQALASGSAATEAMPAAPQMFGMTQLTSTSQASSSSGGGGNRFLPQQQQQQVGPSPASLLLASADMGAQQDYLQGYLTNLQQTRASTVPSVVNPSGIGQVQNSMLSSNALQGDARTLGMGLPFGAAAAAPSSLGAAAALGQSSVLGRDPLIAAALQNQQQQQQQQNMAAFGGLGGAGAPNNAYASVTAGLGGHGQDPLLGSLMAGGNPMLQQGLGGQHMLAAPGSLSRPFLGSAGGGVSGVSPIDGFPLALPIILAQHDDAPNLTNHQVLLRQQVEVFQATEDDANTHTRGRNKPILVGQVGVRCKHCKHLPVLRRQKGSTYFPNSLTGLYQAVQNMNTVHMQCGLCTEMPDNVKQQFVHSMCYSKVHQSGAGRHYWAKAAKKLGLVDTEAHGIRFIRDIPRDAQVVDKTAK